MKTNLLEFIKVNKGKILKVGSIFVGIGVAAAALLDSKNGEETYDNVIEMDAEEATEE